MEVPYINTSEIPDSGKERENWFWDTIEDLRQVTANLATERDMLRRQLDQRDELLEKAREGQKRHGEEIIAMGKELNLARAAAATAVEDYRANVEI